MNSSPLVPSKRNSEREEIMFIDGQTILVTGGTGSFGRRFVHTLLATHKPKKVIVFSRDELKQSEMQGIYGDHPKLRFFLGDVRDKERLHRAFEGVDIVVHAAALKQVPTLEYNPFEAIKTNILGAENIINEAIDQKVTKVVALSTDKAVNPINLYGATKLCAEKLFVAGNSYAGGKETRFSVVRYGNVLGSRGSVIPLFLSKRSSGILPITDKRMTRFWITLDQAVDLVLQALEKMQGGEVFVPKIPSMKIIDLAKAVGPNCRIQQLGVRPGEKLHEVLLTEDESHHAVELGDMYVIHPEHPFWRAKGKHPGKKLPFGFRYSSDNNTSWLKQDQLRKFVYEIEKEIATRGKSK
jgi:UDP-N-acetylglucosamine 4,6-dehydratase/5-epimerase